MPTNPQNLPSPNLRSATLSPLFPKAVVVMERHRPGDPQDLQPVETHYVARARAKRLQEFAAGRACARAALAEFGIHDVALPAAHDRQPLWPSGFVGSITHTTGFCAAAVASCADVRFLGLDSEIVGAPTPDIWATVCRDEELEWIDSLPADEQSAAVTLIFSAKEAFYKAQYPLVSEWLDFHDLSIHAPAWNAALGVFTAAPTRNIRFAGHARFPISGRYAFHGQFVSAAVCAAVSDALTA